MHPSTAKCLHHLGLAYLKIKLFCDAQTCALVSYQMYQKLYGYGMETMTVFLDYGKAFNEIGNIILGVRYLEKALRDAENILGEHDKVASIYEELAAAKEKLNQDPGEIQNLKDKASKIREQYQRKSKVSGSILQLLIKNDASGFRGLSYISGSNLENLFDNHFFMCLSFSFNVLFLLVIVYYYTRDYRLL